MTTPDTVGEMFYLSGDDVDQMIELAIQCGIDNRGTSWPVKLCRLRAKVRAELCRAARAAVERCDICDGTGLLHRADGMYVGECHCVHSAHAGGDVRHSTHHVRRGPESLPCYCGAFTDHQIGDEQ